MKIEVPIVSAFVDGEAGGNPAGVVLNAERFSSEQKQKIAAAVGLSETAFVSPSKSADIKLEFFTPTQQIAHCGHATIATFSFLKQNGLLVRDRSSKETIDGLRSVNMESDSAYMEQTAPRFETLGEDDLQATLQSLGLAADDLIEGAVPMLVNTGNSFVVIGIRDSKTIKGLKPDFVLIEKLSESLDLIGFYVFSLDGVGDGRDAGTRMFAPRYGILEESATGMAAGPLACYLREQLGMQKHEFTIEQGRWMATPSPSVINVRLTIGNDNGIENLFAGGRGSIKEVVHLDL
ncbi:MULTISPECIES: PhzF family phenazine biosynthesis protein [Marinobacter]|uniref:PhzF family phenazine biosynthesis protein n=1 Tax=Marinobacter TaxID=2742 RepID=UPI001B0EF434|nr:PhzF family phenazine biosynthesis protein [Marinobacter sp.]MBO6812146.1 PhzF family phenazine biosynthesis protein [Marinobacter sp.]MBO6873606.1 PhzF family phenazine biosynthesis protein [Marinobacter sp.]